RTQKNFSRPCRSKRWRSRKIDNGRDIAPRCPRTAQRASLLRRRFAFDQKPVDEAANGGADQRTEPINIMVEPKISGQRRPDVAAKETKTDQGGAESTQQLGAPITERVGHGHMTAAEQTEGYGWIQLTARDVQSGGDKCGNGQTVRQRDGKNIVPGRFDRADPDKDESKGANKFCKPGTEFFHGRMQSNCIRSDQPSFTTTAWQASHYFSRRRSLGISRATAAQRDRPHRFCQPVDRRERL